VQGIVAQLQMKLCEGTPGTAYGRKLPAGFNASEQRLLELFADQSRGFLGRSIGIVL